MPSLLILNNVPWHTMEVFTSVDDKLDCWKSLFTSVVDDHFPLRTIRLRSHSLKWMNDRVTKLMRSRNYFRTKFKRTRCSSDWNKFKLLKKAVIRELRRAKADYFADVARTISHNPRKGWNLLNSAVRPKQKGHIGSIITPSGESITGSADIVHSFNNHFQHFLKVYLQPVTVYLILVLVPVNFILFQSLLRLFWMV